MDRSDTNTFGICAFKLQAVMINFKMFYEAKCGRYSIYTLSVVKKV